MNQFYQELKREEKKLQELLALTEESINHSLDGNLRITHHGQMAQYYYKTAKQAGKSICENSRYSQYDVPSAQGKYIRKKDLWLAKEIAQRDYDKKLQKTALKQLSEIQKLLDLYGDGGLEEIYETMHPDRRALVEARILSDKEYAARWVEKTYVGKPFEEGTAVIRTDKGERVRSKSEKIIADMLYRRGVLYRYEAPVSLRGFGLVYPDFTILNVEKRKEIYWEHLGMMDHKDYCESALRKVEAYQQSGIYLGDRLILTYETAKYPLETAAIERNINVYCVKSPCNVEENVV